MNCTLQYNISKTPRQEPIRSPWSEERTITPKRLPKFPALLGATSGQPFLRNSISDMLKADGRLTPV